MKRGSFLALLAAVAAMVVAVGASAAPTTSAFGNGKWTPGTGYNSQFGLVTRSDATGSYGGVSISNVPRNPADVTALSFDFKTSETGASGGSPRLVVAFDDDGNATLRPLSFVASTWTSLDGMSGSNWDNSGGCGYLYATDWNGVVACHPGASITGMWVVNDSGWLYTSGLTVTLDNITVNDTVAGGPGNSSN